MLRLQWCHACFVAAAAIGLGILVAGCLPRSTPHERFGGDDGKDAGGGTGLDASADAGTGSAASFWNRVYGTAEEDREYVNPCEWQIPIQRADDIVIVADACEGSATTLLRLDRHGGLLEARQLRDEDDSYSPAAVIGTSDGGVLAVVEGGQGGRTAFVTRLDAGLDVVYALRLPDEWARYSAALAESPRGGAYVAMPGLAVSSGPIVVLELSAEGSLLGSVAIQPSAGDGRVAAVANAGGGVTVAACDAIEHGGACVATVFDDRLRPTSSVRIEGPGPMFAVDAATAGGVTALVWLLEGEVLVSALAEGGAALWARRFPVGARGPGSCMHAEIDIAAGAATVATWYTLAVGSLPGVLTLARFDLASGELLGAARYQGFGDWGALDASDEAVVVATRFDGVARFGPDLGLDGCPVESAVDLEVTEATIELSEARIESSALDVELRPIDTSVSSLDFVANTVCESP